MSSVVVISLGNGKSDVNKVKLIFCTLLCTFERCIQPVRLLECSVTQHIWKTVSRFCRRRRKQLSWTQVLARRHPGRDFLLVFNPFLFWYHESSLDFDSRISLWRNRRSFYPSHPVHIEQNMEKIVQISIFEGNWKPIHLLLLYFGGHPDFILPW